MHSHNLYNTLVHVPLIIKVPTFNKHKIITSLARGIDISPTILQVLQIGIPDQFHGRSLLNNVDSNEKGSDDWCYSETLFYGHNWPYDKFGLSYTSDEYKFIYLPTEGKELLYNLETDRYEINNLAEKRKDITSNVKKQIQSYLNIQNFSELVPEKEIKIEKKQLEMLKALGYIK
jgi:arylsulfatase A-like enzyme